MRKEGERGRWMNRAETRGEVIALRCATVVSMEIELTSPLAEREKGVFSLELSWDEQPVIKFAIVHWLPAAFGISDYGGPLLPHLVIRKQNVAREARNGATMRRKWDKQSTHRPSNFICRASLLVGCETPFIGTNRSLKAPVIPATDFA